MIYTIHCQDTLGRRVKHHVDLGDRTSPLFPADLRGVDLTNANLRGADLRHANLEGAILTGADLREAVLRGANLRNADLTYSNLWGADLRESILDGTLLYPAEALGAEFCGAKFEPNSDAAEYARIALEEVCRRTGIRPGLVAFRKLQRIKGFSEFLAPDQGPPARRDRPHYFVESLCRERPRHGGLTVISCSTLEVAPHLFAWASEVQACP